MVLHVADGQADANARAVKMASIARMAPEGVGQDYTVFGNCRKVAKSFQNAVALADVLWLETVVSQALHQPPRNKLSRFDNQLA